MAEFQFKSGIKTLEVKDENGNVAMTFEINVGNKEATKKWIKEISEIRNVSEDIVENENAIDELEKTEQKIVDSILGEGSFIKLMVICKDNVFAMLSFVKYLSSFLNEQMESFYKDYV